MSVSSGAERADEIRAELADGPKSSRELGLPPGEGLRIARELEAQGVVAVDPDRFPDEYVPGNPLVLRLPGDKRSWPGWKHWNV